jgi:hypothetical protein
MDIDLPLLADTVAVQLKLAIQWCQAQAERRSLSVTNLVDYCERFNLWANGIGALHSSSNRLSLAHRLRKAPGFASLFRDLLHDILDDLHQRKPHNSKQYEADACTSQSILPMRTMTPFQRWSWTRTLVPQNRMIS